ncbi:MAG TPA: hypothetical protein VF533_16640 [Solirubrobacteraceae bacterium]|jgi:hypothetical protein
MIALAPSAPAAPAVATALQSLAAGRDPRPAAAPLSSTLSVAVDAPADAVRAALAGADPGAAVIRTLGALGLLDRAALLPAAVPAATAAARTLGMIWRLAGTPSHGHVPAGLFPVFSAPGHVKVRWDIAVRPGAGGTAFLAIRTSFEATDHRSRERLLDAWGQVAPLARELARRAAAVVEAVAEGDEAA